MPKRSPRRGWIAATAACLLLLTACAAGANDVAGAGAGHDAGFWLGLWHGLISPITFVISLFTSKVSIYEVHNNGNWYDVGFVLGIATAFSGAGRAGAATPGRRER
ncbi:hypothetical protein [Kribbella ginsengisoli]|uniref:Uncharacterized protein n=1 Tax=Kribbella ginsengisoli TaxID=363865 RepID=A0ABP6YZ26_9ACTN